MLANMLVKQAGYEPVNCVILNHSPYSLESRLAEDIQPGHHQTSDARVQTFKNFCALMATHYKGGEITEADILAMEAACTLRKPSDNPLRTDTRYRRDNNGRVYNYFCPNDGTVSLKNIQGFGWRGIPEDIASHIPNLYQRVFYQHGEVGTTPDGKPFSLPPVRTGDADYSSVGNASYTAHDVMVNGEELPVKFIFTLQGQIIIKATIQKREISRIPPPSIRTARTPISPIQQKPTPSNGRKAPHTVLADTKA
jgi:hypothetical protein